MKESITSLDLMFLVKEMKERLIGGRIRRIKQTNNTFIFEIYKQERFFLKVILDKAIYIAKASQRVEKPTNFCMQLRKHLLNKTISNICQVEFDRIVEMEVNGYRVILELFGKGNLILTDSSGLIIGILKQQVWKDRTLKPKAVYKYPPSNINPFRYDFIQFQKVLTQINKEIVKALASNFGLGGTYTEEFCEKLGIDKSKLASQLEQKEVDKLYRFFEQLKTIELKPSIILDEKPIDAVPFEMVRYKDYKKIEFDSFGKAIEAYFESLEKKLEEEKELKIRKKEEGRIRRILEKQKLQLKTLERREEECRKIAKILYENYHAFNEILNSISALRQKKLSWQKIEQEIKKQRLVKEIRPKEAKVRVVINSFTIDLDFRKTIEENASYYFEQAKKAKKKIEGIKQAMKKFEALAKKEAKVEEKKWYEKFRWFFSSDSFLIVAGKDAKTNENIVKKHAREQDLVLHADIHGAPFVVVRNDKKQEIPMQTIVEAAEFAASHSKAWKLKLGSVDVSYMKPNQLVKRPGLPLGTFEVKERNILKKVALMLSIGVTKEMKIISGPLAAVKKQTPYTATIVPGDKSSEELAKEIKKQLLLKVPFEIKKGVEEINLEEIKRHIPFGIGELA
ncbi:MAG: ribosome rescue protein RqcH [Candidatus Aenigmarchaeota archaeon]|nr:ribosome rescue protein RqcH [Candidatus Aenigmarchaeota archaeon]